MSPARAHGAAAGALAVAIVAGLVALAELVVVPARVGASRDAFLLGFVSTAERVEDVALNEMGFTGDVVTHPKPPDTLRVLTLGGSVLFNRRITERLDARLERASPHRVELLGAALRSHTTWASIHKYRRLAAHDFDLVLIYHGINDLYANHVAPEDFREDYSHLNPWYRRGVLLDHSVIARLAYNEWIWRRPPRVETGAGLASAEVFARNLETLVREVRAHGGTPVLMTFAWSIPPDYSYARFQAGQVGYENPEHYDEWPVELWGPVDWVRRGLIRHNVAVHEVAGRTGVPLVDQERLLGKDPAWFGDVCHPSEAGVDVFVDNLAVGLEAAGLLD